MNVRIRLMFGLCASGYVASLAPAWSAMQESEHYLIAENQMTEHEERILYQTRDYEKLLLGPDWFQSRGYGYVKNDSYLAYDDAQLLALARVGDPIAEVVAVETLLFKTYEKRDFQELMRFHESAVVNGFSSTFMKVIATYISRAHYFDELVSPEISAPSEPEPPLIDSLADDSAKGNAMKALIWQFVAQMRGDPLGGLNGPGLEAFGLSDADRASACDLANELYGKLNDIRQSRGNSAFTYDLALLSPTNISSFGSLCENWPVPRLNCVKQPVDAGVVPLSGYRCTPAPQG